MKRSDYTLSHTPAAYPQLLPVPKSVDRYLQCVFEWLGIDGQSMQMLLFVSKSNEYLWKETSLTEEEKVEIYGDLYHNG